MTRRLKSAVELVSDIGSKAFDLQHHSDEEIREAVRMLRHVNGPMFDWLVLALKDTSVGGISAGVDCAGSGVPRTVNRRTRDKD